MLDLDKYQFEIRELSAEEGGGFLVSYPDFSECVADGETIEEALQNGRQALAAVIETLKEVGMPVPEPECNTWDILAKHAQEESKAGKTVTLEEFESNMKIISEYALYERQEGKSMELRAYAKKHKIKITK